MTARDCRADPERIIRHLRSRSSLPGFICPDYDCYSITRIAPLVLQNFNLPAAAPPPMVELLGRSFRRILLVVVDSFGYRLMERCQADTPALTRLIELGTCLPLTVTFPSTTTVALTAIYTGLSPAEHRVTGHTMFVRTLGAVADILRFSPRAERRRDVYTEQGWNVRELFPMRTVFEPLQEAGLQTLSLTRAQFCDSALGLLHHAGAEVIGYLTLPDMLTIARDALRARRDPGLICVYWDTIDMLSHRYGPTSDAVRAAVAQFFYGMEREVLSALSPEERRDTLLLLTADHGQVDCYPEEAVCLGEHPQIVDSLLLPPAGQTRAAYLYAVPRAAEQLPGQLRELGERIEPVTSWQALASGLFGPPELAANLDTRVGDVIALARGGTQLHWIDHPRSELHHQGHHGSLTEEEMLVPLIAMPLDAW
jgi:hypothetical protein